MSEAMGAQPTAELLALLRQCEATDGGVMVERRTGELGLDTLDSRLNLATSLTLDYDSGHIDELAPTDDDLLTANDWTITRTGGSFGQVEQTTGPMGTDSITGAGRYERSATLSLYEDAQARHQAGWRVWLGTVNEYRYPQLQVKLHNPRLSALVDTIAAVDVSDRVTVTNLPSTQPPDDAELMVEGYTEVINSFEWTIAFNCAPYSPYNVLTLADDTADSDAGRVACDEACALRTAIDSNDLSMAVDPNFYRWTTRLLWDAFGRTESNGWGTSDSGHAWTTSGGAASDFSTATSGDMLMTSVNVARVASLAATVGDCDIRATIATDQTATGDYINCYLFARGAESDSYWFRVALDDDGSVDLFIQEATAGAASTLTSVGGALSSYSADTPINVRAQLEGLNLRLKVWIGTEPSGWNLETTDSSYTSGAVGFRTLLSGGNTNANPTVSYDDFAVSEAGDNPDDFPLNVRLGGEVVAVSANATTAATYVAAGAGSHADNAAVTPALYAGGAADDLICVLARIRGSAGSLATPTDYTLVKKAGNLYLFGKVHDGSESDPTITPSGGSAGDTVSAFTFGLRGMSATLDDLADMVVTYDTRSNSSAQNIAYGGVYPPRKYPGCVVLLLAGKSDDWTSVAPPSGFTEIGEPDTTTGSDQGLYAAYQIQTTPTVVNEGSLVVTGGASAVSESMILALPGGYQTFTLSARAVNGVTKSHAAGTLIEVEDPLVLAL